MKGLATTILITIFQVALGGEAVFFNSNLPDDRLGAEFTQFSRSANWTFFQTSDGKMPSARPSYPYLYLPRDETPLVGELILPPQKTSPNQRFAIVPQNSETSRVATTRPTSQMRIIPINRPKTSHSAGDSSQPKIVPKSVDMNPTQSLPGNPSALVADASRLGQQLAHNALSQVAVEFQSGHTVSNESPGNSQTLYIQQSENVWNSGMAADMEPSRGQVGVEQKIVGQVGLQLPIKSAHILPKVQTVPDSPLPQATGQRPSSQVNNFGLSGQGHVVRGEAVQILPKVQTIPDSPALQATGQQQPAQAKVQAIQGGAAQNSAQYIQRIVIEPSARPAHGGVYKVALIVPPKPILKIIQSAPENKEQNEQTTQVAKAPSKIGSGLVQLLPAINYDNQRVTFDVKPAPAPPVVQPLVVSRNDSETVKSAQKNVPIFVAPPPRMVRPVQNDSNPITIDNRPFMTQGQRTLAGVGNSKPSFIKYVPAGSNVEEDRLEPVPEVPLLLGNTGGPFQRVSPDGSCFGHSLFYQTSPTMNPLECSQMCLQQSGCRAFKFSNPSPSTGINQGICELMTTCTVIPNVDGNSQSWRVIN